MKKGLVLLLAAGLFLAAPVWAEEEDDDPSKKDKKRAEINQVADEALQQLFSESPKTKELYDKAYGWAVFDNLKITIIISGGGGAGVAVNKGSGERTYMKMGTGGVAFGLGGKKYQVIFLFENEKTYNTFVETGWQADTQAGATAGSASADVAAEFHGGLALFQITESGLMASADVSGTKYWKNDKLNED